MARRMVSRAERKALERAEAARAEAEAILASSAAATIDAEAVVRREFESRLQARTEEMDRASRRATMAESALDLARLELAQLRAKAAEAGVELVPIDPGGSVQVPGLEMVGPDPPRRPGGDRRSGSDDTDRLVPAATAAAQRMHAQAALALARAREEAIGLLRSATQQAEDLLAATMATIERDTAITQATRDQAERDSAVAATLRADLEQRWEDVEAQCEQLRTEARGEARRIVEEAEREAAKAMTALRSDLSDELTALRKAMDSTRGSFESFLDAQPLPVPGPARPAGPTPAGGTASEKRS